MRHYGLLAAWTMCALACAGKPAGAGRESDIVYLKDKGAAFTLDVFRPERPTGAAIIFVVSGGWVSDHNGIRPELAKLATDRNMTAFFVVHGAQPRYKVPEIVEQVRRSVRFIRANATRFGIDANRIGITGGSAGGHLSLMVAALGSDGSPNAADSVDRTSDRVQAVGIFYPPTDFRNYGAEGNKAFSSPVLKLGYGKAFVDDLNAAKPEEWAKLADTMSPVARFSKAMPPCFFVHGDKDGLVPIQQSEHAVRALKSFGVEATLLTVPGKAHGWAGQEREMGTILDWFAKKLAK
ncbi:MAG: alpha/beta hydrolase [Fimbriimonadaceae bacterium]|nr:alpha/beta hydrolase [Fimbriimonadaceae bacterium]